MSRRFIYDHPELRAEIDLKAAEAVARLSGRLMSRRGGQAGNLWDRLCREADSCPSVTERLALFRAFHTAGLELADRADDSYGHVGDLRIDAFEAYVDIDWAAAGMPDHAYWQDLCELLVWEPYALTHQRESLPFRRAAGAHADTVERILLALAEEHRAAHLNYQADEALDLVASLRVTDRR